MVPGRRREQDEIAALPGARDWPQAASRARRRCVERPDAPDAWLSLGVALQAAGRFAEALHALDHAVVLDPTSVAAHNARGVVLGRLSRPRDAFLAFERAARLAPENLAIRLNLARAANLCGDERALEAALDVAVTLEPEPGPAHVMRFDLRFAQGRFESCLSDADALAQSDPTSADAHLRRASVLIAQGAFRGGLRAARRAQDLAPGHPRALALMAEALAACGRTGAAEPLFAEARAAEPSLERQVSAQVPGLAPDEAASAYLWLQALRAGHRALERGDWSDYAGHLRRFEAVAAGGADARWVLRARGLALRAQCVPLREATRVMLARAIGEGVAQSVSPAQRFDTHRRVDGPIRVGLVSANFREHVNAHNVLPLFEHLDRARFTVLGYALQPVDASAVATRIVSASDRFTDLSEVGDAEAAARIRADAVEILVDLGGYTSGARPGVFARRPAPVQVLFQGYWTTLGGGLVDYVLTDATASPPERREWFDESRVYLPGAAWVGRSATLPPAVPQDRAAHGLDAGAVVIACFSRTFKITPEVFDVWAEILAEVQQAQLWLMADDEAVPDNLRREARRRGVDPGRLVFAPWAGRASHAARCRLPDLFVDTWPYGGHTTLVDALDAGVPAVTRACEGPYGRIGASLLRAAGLDALVAEDAAGYARTVIALAADPAVRAAYARRLDCAFLDPRRQVGDVARALEAVASRHRAGEAPGDLSVPGGNAGPGAGE